MKHGWAAIDIAGFRMTSSQKFRNVRRDGRVALVVDDIASTQPWRVRFLEIRGIAEAVPDPADAGDPGDGALIRPGVTQPPEASRRGMVPG